MPSSEESTDGTTVIEDPLERLRRLRGGQRSATTKLIQSARDAIKQNIGNLNIDVLAKTTAMCVQLKEKRQVLQQLDNQILGKCPSTDIDRETEEATEVSTRIIEIATKLEDFALGKYATRHEPVINATPNVSTPAPSNPAPAPISLTPTREVSPPNSLDRSNSESMNFRQQVRLPKINLPRFNGDITRFQSFWQSFKCSIDENETISDVHKMNYLMSLLEGPAYKALQGFEVTDENYNHAKETLQKRFGNQQTIIGTHMKALLSIEGHKNMKTTELRELYDNVNVHIRGLEALGISSDKYGCLLIPVILKSMPEEINLIVARNTSQDVWNIKETMEIIRTEIEARERSHGISSFEPVKTGGSHKFTNPKTSQPGGTTRSFVSKGARPNKISCYFCTNEHYSNECTVVKDVEKRKSILREAKRCFNCLRTGHIVKDCLSKSRCKKCHQKHNTAICNQKNEPSSSENKPTSSERTLTTATSKEKVQVLLQTARASVFGRDREKRVGVNVLFDGGSQKSYVTEKLKNKLALETEGNETINLNTFGSDKFKKQSCERVEINVDVGDNVLSIKALTFPTICSPMATRVDLKAYPHLQGLQLADSFSSPSDREIGLLIGADYYHEFVTGDIIKGSAGPVATSSKLGWLLSGNAAASSTDIFCNNVNSVLVIDTVPMRNEIFDENLEINDTLKEFWRHETAGLAANLDDKATNEDLSVITNITFNKEERKYEVSLPWKENISDKLPSDYDLCRNRLNSLFTRLKGKPELLREYDSIFKEQLHSGIIERVPTDEEDKASAHFICHHGVIKLDRETTKLRVVFDGSARSNSQVLSLNDHLETGANYMPLLFDTIIRLRSHQVALTADIEKAFHQIVINSDDREVLRFLWYDDISKEKPSIVQYRHRRLIFGLKCSPTLLSATIRHHVEEYRNSHPEVVEILSNLYADDLSCGAVSATKAFEIYQQAKEIMLRSGFNLRKWNSNDKGLLERINAIENAGQNSTKDIHTESQVVEDDESYSKFAVGNPSMSGRGKVLGVTWDSEADKFLFDLKDIMQFARTLPPTKRSILKIAAKIFDPLGCLCVFVINLKAFFQQLCFTKLGWDQELEGPERKKFDQLILELEGLEGIQIDRCLFQKGKTIERIELHGFSDASEKAHGCVVYLRIVYKTGEVEVRFLAAKSKVNPIKKQSIPRLELLGACLLANLVNTVRQILQEELKDKNVELYYWVDSMSTLCWIKNPKPWTQYVRNRVSEIRKLSDRERWLFCPGQVNPADMPSRGIYGKNLATNLFWWEGPEFLKLDQSEWPRAPTEAELRENDTALKEKVKHEPTITHAMLAREKEVPIQVNKILDLSRFSSKGKLLRSMAWVLRFVDNVKCKVNCKDTNTNNQVSIDELERAENIMIRSIQQEAFSKEISYLQNNASGLSKTRPPIYVNQFNLYIDEKGVLRCRTRIKNAQVRDSTKKPILLPPRNPYSELLIKDSHERVFHNGVRETLNMLRQKYWILRGRESVKRITKRCILCKKLEGLAYSSVFSKDLPSFRVDNSPPFCHVGIDFAGPLYISSQTGNKKCYICLFTCTTTRAVHLELVESLEVETFIRCFRRFTARRGVPATILSDNAKTFKAASKEIRRLLRSPRLTEHFLSRGVKWKWIVELSPWKGGIWERLIRSTKRCLVKVVGRSLLSFTELSTILVEIEAVINSRPLTYVFDDSDGISYPLTPSQLINGRNLEMWPNDRHCEIVSNYETLSKRSRFHRKVLTQFSCRWKTDYLLSLLEAYKPRDGSNEPTVEVGDIVLVKNDHDKRSFWKLAEILELYKGKDQCIRAAKIRVAGENKRVLNRSLKHLIPLEVRSEHAKLSATATASKDKAPAQKQRKQTPSDVQQPQRHSNRPRRNAATIGELIRQDRS